MRPAVLPIHLSSCSSFYWKPCLLPLPTHAPLYPPPTQNLPLDITFSESQLPRPGWVPHSLPLPRHPYDLGYVMVTAPFHSLPRSLPGAGRSLSTLQVSLSRAQRVTMACLWLHRALPKRSAGDHCGEPRLHLEKGLAGGQSSRSGVWGLPLITGTGSTARNTAHLEGTQNTGYEADSGDSGKQGVTQAPWEPPMDVKTFPGGSSKPPNSTGQVRATFQICYCPLRLSKSDAVCHTSEGQKEQGLTLILPLLDLACPKYYWVDNMKTINEAFLHFFLTKSSKPGRAFVPKWHVLQGKMTCGLWLL
jgi:hypothetical protein